MKRRLLRMDRRERKQIMKLNRTDRPASPPTVHRILQRRRQESRSKASLRRHLRAVARDGDGDRCYECRFVPLNPWEPVYLRDEFGMTRGESL